MLKRLLQKVDEIAIEIVISIFIAVFLLVYFAPLVFYSISPGNVGVLWKRFGEGTVVEPGRYLREGLHTVWPWDKVYIYDAHLKQAEKVFDALSADGLHITLDVAYRYRLNPEIVGLLHKYVGPDWENVILAPEVAAKARDIIARDTPEEVFSSRRVEIQNQIRDEVVKDLYDNFNPQEFQGRFKWVTLEDVLIRGITLPPEIANAIIRKNEQNQLNQEYDFRLLREAKEAERKKIEATGIKQFQDIVSSGITDSYLRLRGIEATQNLAESPNAKIVIIGSGKEGMPLILGNLDNDKTTSPDTATPPSANLSATPQTKHALSDAPPSASPTQSSPAGKPKEKASANAVKPSIDKTVTPAETPVVPPADRTPVAGLPPPPAIIDKTVKPADSPPARPNP